MLGRCMHLSFVQGSLGNLSGNRRASSIFHQNSSRALLIQCSKTDLICVGNGPFADAEALSSCEAQERRLCAFVDEAEAFRGEAPVDQLIRSGSLQKRIRVYHFAKDVYTSTPFET